MFNLHDTVFNEHFTNECFFTLDSSARVYVYATRIYYTYYLLLFIIYYSVLFRRIYNDPDHRHRVMRHYDIHHVVVLCQSPHHQSVGKDQEKNRKIRNAARSW